MVEAFVGSKAPYYLAKWRKLASGRSRLAGFNWAAAFFPAYWLLYRQFFVAGWLLWLALHFAAPILATMLIRLGATRIQADALYGAALVPVCAAVGLAANVVLYRRFARARDRALALTAEQLRKLGGTSPLAVYVAVVLRIVVLLDRFVRHAMMSC